MKYFHIVLLCLTLTACSSLATSVASRVLGEQPTLSVDAQLGDRTAQLGDKHQVNTKSNEGIITVTSDTSKSSKKFQHADTVNIQEGASPLLILLLVLGWLLPSPLEMYREVKSWFIK